MTRSTLASLFLGAALIGTNVFWAYWAVDASLSYTYQAVSLEDNQQALAQALAVIKVAVRPDASKEQVIGAASMTATGDRTMVSIRAVSPLTYLFPRQKCFIPPPFEKTRSSIRLALTSDSVYKANSSPR